MLRMPPNVQQATIKPIITAAVAPGSLVHTDEHSVYARLDAWGFHHKTDHGDDPRQILTQERLRRGVRAAAGAAARMAGVRAAW